jgi:hypothetical protein
MIRSDIRVDWSLSPRIIIIPYPSTELIIQDLVDTCRELEYDAVSEPYLVAAAGKDDLGAGTKVGLTATLNNAVVLFEPRVVPLVESSITSISQLTSLNDSSANFTNSSIFPGCTIFNKTTGAFAIVTKIESLTSILHLALSGGIRQNWQIGDLYEIFPNDQCNISGGNLVAVDSTGTSMSPVMSSANTQIVKTSSASATLQQLAEIQQGMFQERVTINVTSGSIGTDYPLGTPQYPINNLADAKTIAAFRGFHNIQIVGNLIIGASESISGFTLLGQGVENTIVTLTSGCTTSKTTFEDMTVEGRQNGETHYHQCEIGVLQNVHCEFFQCRLIGPITMHQSYADTTVFFQCYSGDTAGAATIIDLTNSPVNMAFSDWNGFIQFQNMNKLTAGTVVVNMSAGKVVIDNTCTHGAIKVRGTGEIIDNSAGTVVDNDTTAVFVKAAIQPQLDRIDQIPTTQGLTSQQIIMLTEMYKLMGLDPTKPLVVEQTQRTVSTDIVQTIVVDDILQKTTVTRI